MILENKEPPDKIRKIAESLKTEEGQKFIEESAKRTRKWAEEFDKNLKINPKLLYIPINL